jgi:hypothetical protein
MPRSLLRPYVDLSTRRLRRVHLPLCHSSQLAPLPSLQLGLPVRVRSCGPPIAPPLPPTVVGTIETVVGPRVAPTSSSVPHAALALPPCFTQLRCSMEFDPFGLFVKDIAIRSVIARYNSFGPFYTLRLPVPITSTPNVVPYSGPIW